MHARSLSGLLLAPLMVAGSALYLLSATPASSTRGAQAVAPSTTTTTAAAEPEPEDPPAPSPLPQAAPTTAAPRPRATTATTAPPPSIESRGQAALALITYPWARTGFSVVFTGPRDGMLGLTSTSTRTITIYVRDGESTAEIARTLAHEIGHAVDIAFNAPSDRAAYRVIRGLGSESWYPDCNACSDYAWPAGDWAETFAWWLLGPGTFESTIAGPPTAAQLAALTPLFSAPSAVEATTTTSTSTSSTTTTSTTTWAPPPQTGPGPSQPGR